MRKLFFFFAIVFSQLINAQVIAEVAPDRDNEKNLSDIHNAASVEMKPEYPGGIEAFYKHVATNFKSPTHKDFKGGKIIVSFVVEKDGTLTDIKVLRDAGFGTAEETVRVLKSAKTWQPAEQNGRKVRCQYMLPISLMSPQ